MVSYDFIHPCSIDELVARSDRAMYEQKRGNHEKQPENGQSKTRQAAELAPYHRLAD